MAYKPGRCLLHFRLKEVGMTPQDLADRIQMPRQQISDYANDRYKMGLANAKTIAMAIGCSIDDLYEWKLSISSAHKEKA
ncbi:helix-turn-helix transcriptional regulator [Paenibacillus tyrfis]|uniref:helix-turn-helix transcriptional regulator n=1 Tax=Paenibacillus tyrfis TaxID=1501230 RepID=UPI000B58A302|nr:helix-turn-helix transcriptional regulator [Paenibacillus tyrfis]